MYIPLRIMTHASLGLSTLTHADIAQFSKENNIPAVGITEINSLAGSLGASKTLKKSGIQHLIGAQITLTCEAEKGHLHVYARNPKGHEGLLALTNYRAVNNIERFLSVDEFITLTTPYGEDLIVLTGGKDGLMSVSKADDIMARFAYFPHLFVEIERNSSVAGENEGVMHRLSIEYNRPIVATSPMVCKSASMTKAHEVYLGISAKSYLASPDRPKLEQGAWLVDDAEFKSRFADIPHAVDATLKVAQLCQASLNVIDPKPPAFPFVDDENKALADDAKKGLEKRLEDLKQSYSTIDEKLYQGRLAHEIGLIQKMGFSGYFLIVADFINWAKSNNVPVGPGRGSGAGSLVAYALGITDIDPIKFDLLFERFLNPDRVSMPDFDIDFSQAKRGEVIEYVRHRYGDQQVAHIGTYALLQARAVFRNVGRVMGAPYMQLDEYAKLIPQNPTDPISLAQAMETDELSAALEKADSTILEIFAISLELEGLYSHISTHAAGIVISDKPVCEIVPVYRDEKGALTTSFDMKDVEASGLVKFDFLGLKNLDIIDEALAFIEKMHGYRPDIDTINFEDEKTYQNLAAGNGFGVFQVESGGMKRAMRDLNVENFEDIIALISLYRPGPMDQIETYADVKSGRLDAQYPHPECEDILKPTYGVMVYQEQVMGLAKSLAGYSLGQADVLRRAMGKKIKSEMDAQREGFVNGAQAGWVMVDLDDGRQVRLHAHQKLPLADGSGNLVSLQEALDKNLEIVL